MIRDYIEMGLSSLKRRKMRSGMTLMGVFIGVALFVTLFALGQGLKASIVEQFQTLGMDKIFVTPGMQLFGIGTTGIKLTEDDMAVVRHVKGVDLAAGVVYKIAKVEASDEVKYTWVTGIPLDETRSIFETVHNIHVERGRDLKKGDKWKAVVGIDVTSDKKVFKKGVRIGDKILIEGKEIEIVGSLGRIGSPDDDATIILPIESARELLKEYDSYSTIVAQAQKGIAVKDVAERIKKELRKSRGLKEGDEDFSVQTSDDVMDTFNSIFSIVEIAVLGLATISIIVGAIGIANTMYTAVVERTREIGVTKAIGARNIDIALIFVIESGLIGLFGGIVGFVVGAGLGKAVELVAHIAGLTMFKVYLSWYVFFGVLAFSFFLGVVSGFVPALKAAMMRPVDALRYE